MRRCSKGRALRKSWKRSGSPPRCAPAGLMRTPRSHWTRSRTAGAMYLRMAEAAEGDKQLIRLKRAYETAFPADGERVLVERLWPRGVSKARAAIVVWLKEVAPSPELRRW